MPKDTFSAKITARFYCLCARYYQSLRIGLLTWTCAITNIACIVLTFYLHDAIKNHESSGIAAKIYSYSNSVSTDNDALTHNDHDTLSLDTLIPLFALIIAFKRSKTHNSRLSQ